MKFQQWPKRDPDKTYFKVPNEVFHIGLSYPEISVYCYLLSIEDRETYQCYPSYKTIGKALGMSENTVSKYVRSLERRYQEDGSRSITAFIERAVDFYLDYLSANNAGLFLPTSIKSYLDGRMGQLEERLSSIAFRQAVEQDMVAGILADEYQFSNEDLRRRRAESVQNVRKTNGRISLEQRVRGAWEEDDEWQD